MNGEPTPGDEQPDPVKEGHYKGLRSKKRTVENYSEAAHRLFERNFMLFSAAGTLFTLAVTVFAAVAAYWAYTATQDAANTTRQQLQDAEAANVTVTGLEAIGVNEYKNEKQIQINPVFKNNGTLSANNFRYVSHQTYCDKNEIKHIKNGYFPEAGVGNLQPPIHIAGQQETRVILRHQINENHLEELRSGRIVIYVYGSALYDASFSSKVPKETHFFRYCYAILGLPKSISGDQRMQLTDVHFCGEQTNCVDNECGSRNHDTPPCPGLPEKKN